MKFKNKIHLCLLLILTTLLFAGCGGNSAGDKYAGKWTGPNFSDGKLDQHLEITTTDGKVYSLTVTDKNNHAFIKDVAMLKDQSLEVSNFEKLIIRPDGVLQFRSTEYRKDPK